jgi:hypothetical protein
MTYAAQTPNYGLARAWMDRRQTAPITILGCNRIRGGVLALRKKSFNT